MKSMRPARQQVRHYIHTTDQTSICWTTNIPAIELGGYLEILALLLPTIVSLSTAQQLHNKTTQSSLHQSSNAQIKQSTQKESFAALSTAKEVINSNNHFSISRIDTPEPTREPCQLYLETGFTCNCQSLLQKTLCSEQGLSNSAHRVSLLQPASSDKIMITGQLSMLWKQARPVIQKHRPCFQGTSCDFGKYIPTETGRDAATVWNDTAKQI